ncbi:MAG TPA: sigma-70 family RNA polymerase sigma factor, partial [Armatimonadota bacterium]|nr:sigma-70 family RNA polymerase sigma factor [Armatimonadota bacterium]
MQDWLADVQRAQEGDLAAFDRVVKRFEGMAVAYAYSILGDFQLAEDAAQEAFIQAYCDLHTLQRSCAFPAWLRRLIFKHCDRQLRRKRVPMLPLDATLDVPDRGMTPLEALQQKETHEVILGAINSLPDPVRAVTVLFYISGYSMTEVGDFLELPVSTVKNRLHTARTKLRERMMIMAEETIKQHAPGDAFSARVTKVLGNIERIHWDTTAVICFAGAVAATMRYLGEPVSNDYVMGISGGAFKLFWHPEWAGDNCDLLIYGEEPIRRTFAALGYAYQFIPFPETIPAEQREQCRKQIIASLDAGKPVLAQGLVGPPECSVIAGYDQNGVVHYGRSYFQEKSDESGYFRVENWE